MVPPSRRRDKRCPCTTPAPWTTARSSTRRGTATSPSSSPSDAARSSAAGTRAWQCSPLASAPNWCAPRTTRTAAAAIPASFRPTPHSHSTSNCLRLNRRRPAGRCPPQPRRPLVSVNNNNHNNNNNNNNIINISSNYSKGCAAQ